MLLLGIAIAADAEENSYVTIEANVAIELAPNNNKWEGEVPFEFRVTYVKPISNKMYFTSGYSHLSNVLSGAPFNDDPENYLDRVFIGIGVKFNL